MFQKQGLPVLSLAVLALVSCLVMQAHAVNPAPQSHFLVTQPVDETRRVTLGGNTRPEANPGNDLGPVAGSYVLDHMLLQLRQSPEQEQALESFIQSLHTPGSPNYHHWITAAEFGQKFGLAKQDLNAITAWLRSHGLTVNVVYENGMLIDFSGTAAQVKQAFKTEIHNLSVNGEHHISNMSDPQIPAALAGAVAGVVSLHDFAPQPMHKPITSAHIDSQSGTLASNAAEPVNNYTFKSGATTFQSVVPADLATIYNFNPLFDNGTAGQGQTIAVIEDTDLYSSADWSTFRNTLGLSSFTTASLTTVHPKPPSGTNNCTDPGVARGNDAEAILDTEWASAAAPGAAIVVAACRDTVTTFGGLIALQNLLHSATPPAIISLSYGECEALNGATANAAYNSAYQLGVTEGVSIFVASGDWGAAACDAGAVRSQHGIGVSGLASTPYNVAVGGTDFGDTYAKSNSTYWNSTNDSSFGSAISYVPEIAWNDSCASVLLSTFLSGSGKTYSSSGFCNTTTGRKFLTTIAGSGGPSGCATGKASTSGVVGGTCKGYAKPSWQSGVVGIPNDGVRDLPDVSLFAANGLWGHYYVFCWSHVASGGAACTGAPSSVERGRRHVLCSSDHGRHPGI